MVALYRQKVIISNHEFFKKIENIQLSSCKLIDANNSYVNHILEKKFRRGIVKARIKILDLVSKNDDVYKDYRDKVKKFLELDNIDKILNVYYMYYGFFSDTSTSNELFLRFRFNMSY